MVRVVAMKDKAPLVIRKENMPDVVAVCRCGLSAAWPMCDGTHKKVAAERGGEVYQYARKEIRGDLYPSRFNGHVTDLDPRPGIEPEHNPTPEAVRRSKDEIADGESELPPAESGQDEVSAK